MDEGEGEGEGEDESELNNTFEIDTGFDHRASKASDTWRHGFVVRGGNGKGG